MARFDLGVGWARGIKVIPLCCYGLYKNQLPLPFSRWQGANLNRLDSFKALFKNIAREFELNYDENSWLDDELRDVVSIIKQIK